MQITDRANIVLRLLAGLGAIGIERVVIMPENSGIRQHVMRGLERASNLGEARFPLTEYLDMAISSSSQDSIDAARRMHEDGVDRDYRTRRRWHAPRRRLGLRRCTCRRGFHRH